MKKCKKCNIEQLEENFRERYYRTKEGKRHYRIHTCLTCEQEYMRKKRLNPSYKKRENELDKLRKFTDVKKYMLKSAKYRAALQG